MALFKYDGPLDEVEVRIAGNDVGLVKKGESIAVPDELATLTEWPDFWTRADQAKPEKAAMPVAPANERE